jgi:hypothetical protein
MPELLPQKFYVIYCQRTPRSNWLLNGRETCQERANWLAELYQTQGRNAGQLLYTALVVEFKVVWTDEIPDSLTPKQMKGL